MTQKNKEIEIKKLIGKLQKYDKVEYSIENEKELKEISDKLINIGKPAIPQLSDLSNKHRCQSSCHAAYVLGKIGDKKAIDYLIDILEDSDLGECAKEALKKFGPDCIPKVIRKIKYRISHPIKEKAAFHTLTMLPLSTIGEIKCDKSAEFLNKLLDDYMSQLPDEPFDPGEYDWKYKNVDFFHLLDCMVGQQDKRAIPHIEKARDFFPEIYTDHIVCQLAIDRIKNGETESCLPLEALDIAFPGFI